MFTKAIVLSETEFRSLVTDFGEMMREEFADRYPEEIAKREMEEFLSDCFEGLLDEYDVDEAMIFVKGKWREVDSGRLFVELVNEYYKGGLGAFARK
jgi:hypothetical protein